MTGENRGVIDVDLFTDDEIEELRELVRRRDDPGEWSRARLAEGGAVIEGMYREFSDLGPLWLSAGGGVMQLLPSASWVVEKHDQRATEKQAEFERQLKHDRWMTGAAAASGLVGAIIGAVLTVLLTLWLLPQ